VSVSKLITSAFTARLRSIFRIFASSASFPCFSSLCSVDSKPFSSLSKPTPDSTASPLGGGDGVSIITCGAGAGAGTEDGADDGIMFTFLFSAIPLGPHMSAPADSSGGFLTGASSITPFAANFWASLATSAFISAVILSSLTSSSFTFVLCFCSVSDSSSASRFSFIVLICLLYVF